MNLLLLILANTPSANALKDFMEVGVYLLVGAAAFKSFFSKKPTHGELATKVEMESLRLEIKADDAKMHRRLGAITEKLAESVGVQSGCVKDVERIKERMMK